ncbi:hypothetical protein PAMP_011491 [Pampus punctatissimus]
MRTLDKLLNIMDNASHPLHTISSSQRTLFSGRLLLPKCRTNRLKNSFVHHAITLNPLLGGGGDRVLPSDSTSLQPCVDYHMKLPN